MMCSYFFKSLLNRDGNQNLELNRTPDHTTFGFPFFYFGVIYYKAAAPLLLSILGQLLHKHTYTRSKVSKQQRREAEVETVKEIRWSELLKDHNNYACAIKSQRVKSQYFINM